MRFSFGALSALFVFSLFIIPTEIFAQSRFESSQSAEAKRKADREEFEALKRYFEESVRADFDKRCQIGTENSCGGEAETLFFFDWIPTCEEAAQWACDNINGLMQMVCDNEYIHDNYLDFWERAGCATGVLPQSQCPSVGARICNDMIEDIIEGTVPEA